MTASSHTATTTQRPRFPVIALKNPCTGAGQYGGSPPDRLRPGSVRDVDHSRRTHTAAGAPEAIGPYSHAVSSQGLLFCSGQIPLDPQSGELVGDDAAAQAVRCLENLDAVCRSAGARLADAVRCTIYMTDLDDFAEVNEAYAGFFAEDPPSRVTVGVAALPRGAQVEIEAVVAVDG
ncbi:MAG: RidA family protein [Solirubrobacteraceae bacterium]|nr:RidA family protein [Solirubrobacteraceae bacterium]